MMQIPLHLAVPCPRCHADVQIPTVYAQGLLVETDHSVEIRVEIGEFPRVTHECQEVSSS